MTLSVILAELTNDVQLLPALMFTLALSRAVGYQRAPDLVT